MRKFIFAFAVLFAAKAVHAQDYTASINQDWSRYASDSSLTYAQITTLCDSLFALAGFPPPADTVADTAAQEEERQMDGSPYWKYNIWKSFWASRFDVASGRLHDFAADALQALSQNKTTATAPNCARTSALQSSFPGAPAGWQFIGPLFLMFPQGASGTQNKFRL